MEEEECQDSSLSAENINDKSSDTNCLDNKNVVKIDGKLERRESAPNCEFFSNDEYVNVSPRPESSQGSHSPPQLDVISRKTNHSRIDTKKCQVCTAPAGKHIHYGATSCLSCKAFFRRSVQASISRNYVCHGQGDCTILPDTRRSCQKCRMEKCLKVGMNPECVLSKYEIEERFRKKKMNFLRASPSPPEFTGRLRQSVSPQYINDRDQEISTMYGSKHFYLDTQTDQKHPNAISTNIHIGNSVNPLQLDVNIISLNTLQSEIPPTNNAENDSGLMPNRIANSFNYFEAVKDVRHRETRVKDVHPNMSRTHYLDEIVENSITLVRKARNPDLDAISRTTAERIHQAKEYLGVQISSETEQSKEEAKDEPSFTTSTFNSISPATVTSQGFRNREGSFLPEHNHSKFSLLSNTSSGYHTSKSVDSTKASWLQRYKTDGLVASSNSLDSEHILTSNYQGKVEGLMKMKQRVDLRSQNPNIPMSDSEEISNTSPRISKCSVPYAAISPTAVSKLSQVNYL